MKKAIIILSLFLPFLLLTSCNQAKEERWTSLLDKDLSQWRIYQSYAYPNDFRGKAPLDEEGNPIPPIGYDKNERNVFSIIEEDGKPVLHVTGEIYGCIFTKEDYKNYHLRLKVKFGTKKWAPRLDKAMDSGLLYHSQGEAGIDYWLSWMLSLEFQIMEGGTEEGNSGDFWGIASSQADIRGTKQEGAKYHFYDPKGEVKSFGWGGVDGTCHTIQYGNTSGEWTELELICFEDKSLHIVNGNVAMALDNLRYWNGSENVPLVKGKIQLQSEAAEVFFKDIEIKTIEAIPSEYTSFFK